MDLTFIAVLLHKGLEGVMGVNAMGRNSMLQQPEEPDHVEE